MCNIEALQAVRIVYRRVRSAYSHILELTKLGLGLGQSLGITDVGPKWATKSQLMDQGHIWAWEESPFEELGPI